MFSCNIIMKILPIIYNITPNIGQNNINSKGLYSLNVLSKDTFSKSNVSFGVINSKAGLRNLASKRVYHCIYCARPMMGDNNLDRLKSSGIFSRPLIEYVPAMIPYLPRFHKTEKEVFKQVTLMAFEHPDIRLSEAIKKLYPEAQKKLLQEQLPIIQEISKLGNDLPRGWKSKFQNLMKVTKYRLHEAPYIPHEFSGKEFVYKIQRLCKTVKDEYLAQRIIKLTEPLSHPIFKYPKEPLTDKFIQKILTLTETRDFKKEDITKEYLQLLIIDKLKSYADVLNRKDLRQFCDIAEKTINKQPVVIKFSNKSFRYDLKELLDGMPDEVLKNKMLDLSYKLPTSATSYNAFITKHEKSASDAIGYYLLRPSIATIEHTNPKSTKAPGVHELKNYTLACERCNNDRSSSDLKEYIKQFPSENHQLYFRDLLEDVKRKNLDKKTFDEMIENFFKYSGRRVVI